MALRRSWALDVRALDIRSGVAVVLAGLAAEGETHISNVYFIDRGYEHLEAKFASIGAVISRLEEEDHDCPATASELPVEWGATAALPRN